MSITSRTARRAMVLAATLGLVLVGAAPRAFAAGPGNDTYGGRTVVSGIPFSETLDTSAATSDADDADLNTTCGAPVTDASVWYEITPATDGALVVDVSRSDYSAGAIVATGTPGNWNVVGCAPGSVGWSAGAGTTYTILVFDDQYDGGGNGGNTVVTIDVIPPPPSIDITVNPTAVFTSTGTAIVSGTVTCDASATYTELDTFLTQRVGRVKINGSGFSYLTCDGTTRPWSAEVFAENGIFKGGKAASLTFGFVCGAFDCGLDFEERTVQLKGR
jgi:hypothetical protein